MYNKQGFQTGYKGGCGSMGRGGFGGPWGRGKFGGFWGKHAGAFYQPPVNIQETENEYIISLFAAGLVKEDVKLSVKDDILTVLYEGNASTTDEQTTPGNYTHQEYGNRSFERSFRLNDKVITETIAASYAEGILKIVLPKNPATNKPAQTIVVG